MAKLEEIEDSDEEEPPKADEPKLDFNDMLKKAADMKTQALKEKRRLWENAPEWLKNTMVIHALRTLQACLHSADSLNYLHRSNGADEHQQRESAFTHVFIRRCAYWYVFSIL